MANHKQAIKRHRQSLKRHDRNAYFKATMRTLLKRARAALAEGDKAAAAPVVKDAQSFIDHIASKGVIPGGRADRLKSRLGVQLANL